MDVASPCSYACRELRPFLLHSARLPPPCAFPAPLPAGGQRPSSSSSRHGRAQQRRARPISLLHGRRPTAVLRSVAAPSPPQRRPSSSPHSQRRGHSSPWRPSPSPNQRPPCSPGRRCPFPCRCSTTRTTCLIECPIYAQPFFLLSHGAARRALHFLDAGKKNRRSSPPVHSPLPRRESSLSRLLRSEQHVGVPAGCLLFFLRSPVVVVVHPGETATLLVRFRIDIIFL
jgi:hypothetical protein